MASGKRILVVGAGATGGFFGGRLHQAGRDVTFLVRPRRAKLLAERGLRITGLGEETVLTPNLVEADRLTGPYDLVLFTVKAAGLEQAAADVAPAVGPRTLVLPVLNGMRHVDVLTARFGEERVLGGVAIVATTVDGSGDIRRLVDMQSLTYGARSESAPPELADVHALLSDAGFPTALAPDITSQMWAKWAFIASIGAVTALMRGTVGDVAGQPGGIAFADAVVAECAAVAEAAGHPVAAPALENARATVTEIGSPRAPSLYRDLTSGRPVEGEQIFGDLVDRAHALGVSVPLLELVRLNLRVYQSRLG
ncbi:2-dehydropantoate 2-reductase [Amycolatopsis sp. FDAARGOS 1241]|uniref:2-dehydropantoate 2-reductase n=1 Tax=Amycolatopsis sp. FDAARGOS 1241 TaxID=2778070 RepID=UPI00194FC929|nr:2-dehydropantoate 2-reductase [Amycolatopsis sp. FDAARGOS 1241]QRP49253.1 2-dehydropantoate 2-reductase [Amycolatopsis sp. FDAARGOS 1241]